MKLKATTLLVVRDIPRLTVFFSLCPQDSFRAEAAKLLAKYGIASAKPSRKQQQSESEDEEGEDEDCEGDEGESQEGEEGDSQDGSEEGSEEGESGSEEDEQAEEEQPHPSKKAKTTTTPAQPKAALSASAVDPVAVAAASRELPFIIPIPVSYEKFAALVAGRAPPELTMAIQRIRVCNAPALAADSKRKLQVCGKCLSGTFVW